MKSCVTLISMDENSSYPTSYLDVMMMHAEETKGEAIWRLGEP
jgi:hypothetical protein